MCRPVDSQAKKRKRKKQRQASKRKLTLPPRSSPFYCWAGHYMAWNTSLVSSGHLPGCIPSQALVQPHSTCWGWIRNKEDLDTVHTHCSAIAKILVVCHQPCFGQKSRSTIPPIVKNPTQPHYKVIPSETPAQKGTHWKTLKANFQEVMEPSISLWQWSWAADTCSLLCHVTSQRQRLKTENFLSKTGKWKCGK